MDKTNPGESRPGEPEVRPSPVGVQRSPGHRGADMRDTVAELAERAQLISQEAGTKVAAAMKDVISAAAGIAGFAIESARDLVQYMVKRGQMTQDEADKLIRAAEDAHRKRPDSERARPTATKVAAEQAAQAKAEAAARAEAALAAMNGGGLARPAPAPAKAAPPVKPAPTKSAPAPAKPKVVAKAAPAKVAREASAPKKPPVKAGKATKAAPAKKAAKKKR
jgi:polyhydroxyalkanoate synthesis regulator phasin